MNGEIMVRNQAEESYQLSASEFSYVRTGGHNNIY